MQDWKSNLKTMDSLRTYYIIKTDFFLEYYTIHLNQYHLRKLYAQLRCGALNIHVNTGRKNSIPYLERKCAYCNMNAIDDELHFLLICPFHVDLRRHMIPAIYIANSSIDNHKQLLRNGSLESCRSIALFIMH